MVLAPQSTDLPKLPLKPGRWTVGSAATCSYRVVGAGVQPRHALILCGGNAIILKSWDARTWVNGAPVRGEVKLNGGDRLLIGSVEFEVESADVEAHVESRTDAAAEVPADVAAHVDDVLDQLTETLDRTLRTIDGDSSTSTPESASKYSDREERELLRQRVHELEVSSTVLKQELENSQHNLEVLQEELALQHQLAEAVEQISAEQFAWQKRADELELIGGNQDREKKVLAHSWEWLQSDRRQLVIEKEQWQQQYDQMLAEVNEWKTEHQQWLREREEFAASLTATTAEIEGLRQSLRLEKAQWEQERQQIESEMRVVASDLEAARVSVAAQQSEVAGEWSRLQAAEESLKSIRVELDQKMAALESVLQTLELQRQASQTERQQCDAEQQVSSQDREALSSEKLALNAKYSSASESHSLANSEPTTVAKVPTVTRRIAIIHDSDDALLNATPPNDSWSLGVDLTDRTRNEFATFPGTDTIVTSPEDQQEAAEFADDWDTPPETASESSATSQPSTTDENPATTKLKQDIAAVDPASVALRAELARMFNLRELEQGVPANHQSFESSVAASSELNEAFEPAAAESHKSFISDAPLQEGEKSYGGVVMTTDQPLSRETMSVAEPLSFSDDEPVDESVSRYMQSLMARTRGWSEQSVPETAAETPVPSTPPKSLVQPEPKLDLQPKLDPPPVSSMEARVADNDRPVPVVVPTVREIESGERASESTTAEISPVHKQDKDALRAATENMREVANLQALKNVEAAGWARLKGSIKTKLVLAAFSFLLCLCLLYLGFRSTPGFIVLGGCAACIGLLTWIDLFMAIYKIRRRSRELDEQHRKRA